MEKTLGAIRKGGFSQFGKKEAKPNQTKHHNKIICMIATIWKAVS